MVLNYLEAISIGVEQRIMDEHFMKQFFTTIFRNNYNRFGPYIEYVKKQNGTNRVFNSFIELAKKWEKEN